MIEQLPQLYITDSGVLDVEDYVKWENKTWDKINELVEAVNKLENNVTIIQNLFKTDTRK